MREGPSAMCYIDVAQVMIIGGLVFKPKARARFVRHLADRRE